MTKGRWKEQPAAARFAILALAAVAVAGLALIGSGLYIKAKAELSQVLLKRSFAEAQSNGGAARPWPWADFTVAATISAPRLGVSEVVLQGASGQALAFGPVLLNGTPEPGDPGTSVIAAHRDTHFAWLKDVRPGDVLVITTTDGNRISYRAGNGRIADWKDNGINVAAFGQHLALATCWPFDANFRSPLRYILDAVEIDEQVVAIAGEIE